MSKIKVLRGQETMEIEFENMKKGDVFALCSGKICTCTDEPVYNDEDDCFYAQSGMDLYHELLVADMEEIQKKLQFYICYERSGVGQGIIVEASAKNIAYQYFLSKKPNAKIFGMREATYSEVHKPGMPVLTVPKEFEEAYYAKQNSLITIDFGNIIKELDNKNVKICFVSSSMHNWGISLEDNNGNLYRIESYYDHSYLDRLIKTGSVVKFERVDDSISKNVEDWEKKTWDITETKAFIKRQHLDETNKTEYPVYLVSEGGTKKEFSVCDTEQEAIGLCESYDWEYKDENDFVWKMVYDEREKEKPSLDVMMAGATGRALKAETSKDIAKETELQRD